jgi:hypothetical protein
MVFDNIRHQRRMEEMERMHNIIMGNNAIAQAREDQIASRAIAIRKSRYLHNPEFSRNNPPRKP